MQLLKGLVSFEQVEADGALFFFLSSPTGSRDRAEERGWHMAPRLYGTQVSERHSTWLYIALLTGGRSYHRNRISTLYQNTTFDLPKDHTQAVFYF